jgi:imidazolonepropionase-like amidohydrolase
MKITAVTNARVFDGEQVIGARTIVLDGAGIGAVGGPVPPGATVVDAGGGTLLPGLIDSHVHTDLDGLRLALQFGVTTELEMMGYWTPEERAAIAGRSCMNVYPQGDLDDALGAVAALHAAGVDILTGTDVSGPDPAFGGMAHGASVHHELQLLVTAGLTPVQALRAATATPARRFGLTDRGRITPGARADLLLVDGDPTTTTIADTLSIRAVWRRGVRQTAA